MAKKDDAVLKEETPPVETPKETVKETPKEMELIPPAPPKKELELKESPQLITEADVKAIAKATFEDLNKVVTGDPIKEESKDQLDFGFISDLGKII